MLKFSTIVIVFVALSITLLFTANEALARHTRTLRSRQIQVSSTSIVFPTITLPPFPTFTQPRSITPTPKIVKTTTTTRRLQTRTITPDTSTPTKKPTVTPTRKLTPTPTKSPAKKTTPTPSVSSNSVKDYMMDAINDYRRSQGLSSVSMNKETCDFARIRASEITTNFSHDGFRDRIDSHTLPYPGYSKVTENIAMTSNYKDVVQMWINSPGHAENMRADTPYVCVERDGNYYAYEGWKP